MRCLPHQVPEGTEEIHGARYASSFVPDGTRHLYFLLPSVKTLGYCQVGAMLPHLETKAPQHENFRARTFHCARQPRLAGQQGRSSSRMAERPEKFRPVL